MGNTLSAKSSASEKTEKSNIRRNRVLFFLHRTWSVIVTKKSGVSDASSDYDSRYSQYSFCSCSHCQVDDGFSSWCASDFFDSGSSMAPNSEEGGRFGHYPFGDDSLEKEKQRPPIYNPEDYALSLKKWGRKPPNGSSGLYTTASASESDSSRTKTSNYRDYSNPMLMSAGSEMTLRQFGTVSELLMKLKADLRLAYPSFVQEFVAEPLDGITLLLELLRIIQMNQANNNNNVAGSTSTIGKIPPSLQKRALLDELSCLQCILCCCNRYSEAIRKLPASSTGLYTLAVCIMSNVNKSRIIALQLLSKACEPPGNGHTAVSEAMSTLRLRYGEPVRFRFLVGMLMSAGGQGDLLAAGMQFLNTFLDSCGSPQKRIYIQAELEQAGFDIGGVKKVVNINSPAAERIFEQLDRWEKKHINVEVLTSRMKEVTEENDSLRDKVLLLERRIQILQEEKGILMSLEQCLKERCSELQDEVTSLKSPKNTHRGSSKRSGSTPAEDEGISSSERSLTPEGDVQRDSSVYEMYNMQNQTITVNSENPIQAKSCIRIKEDDEETTIDEVIEELKNIINDAETEQYLKEQKMKKENERKSSKVCMRVETSVSDQSLFEKENEIIPANLHPQPPRRTRSLVHLFIPAEDYDYDNKEIFFENETTFTSEEGSDSLLSASKYHLPRLDKENLKSSEENAKLQKRRNSLKRSESFKHLLPLSDSGKAHSSRHGSFHGVVVITEGTPLSPSFQDQKRNTIQELTAHRLKSKSLDRIDDGLDAMVDIVVTEKAQDSLIPTNQSVKVITRSVSNVFGGNQVKRNSVEEKKKMFLPNQKLDSTQYFPRLQEKRNNTTSFLIKRGHMNAGLYSGYIIKEDQQGSYKKKSDYVTSINGKNSLEKVTDLPSGLY